MMIWWQWQCWNLLPSPDGELVSGEPVGARAMISTYQVAAASSPGRWGLPSHFHLNRGLQQENLPSSGLASGFSGAEVLRRFLGQAN